MKTSTVKIIKNLSKVVDAIAIAASMYEIGKAIGRRIERNRSEGTFAILSKNIPDDILKKALDKTYEDIGFEVYHENVNYNDEEDDNKPDTGFSAELAKKIENIIHQNVPVDSDSDYMEDEEDDEEPEECECCGHDHMYEEFDEHDMEAAKVLVYTLVSEYNIVATPESIFNIFNAAKLTVEGGDFYYSRYLKKDNYYDKLSAEEKKIVKGITSRNLNKLPKNNLTLIFIIAVWELKTLNIHNQRGLSGYTSGDLENLLVQFVLVCKKSSQDMIDDWRFMVNKYRDIDEDEAEDNEEYTRDVNSINENVKCIWNKYLYDFDTESVNARKKACRAVENVLQYILDVKENEYEEDDE